MTKSKQNEIKLTAEQLGKTLLGIEAARIEIMQAAEQLGKTLLGIEAARIEIMQAADPVAADRAKRYIWSRIERTQPSSGRAE